jgi:acetyl/propionyl-CoA carboxylase alpha subunit
MENYKESKAYLEAKAQNESKNRLSAEIQSKLDTLLRKSTSEITHEEMLFVLDNMDMQSLINAAAEKQNKQITNLNDEQKN